MTRTLPDEGEIVADLTELVDELSAEGTIELATKHGARSVATDLVRFLEDAGSSEADVFQFFLDHQEIVEVYAEPADILAKLERAFARLRLGDGPCAWNADLEQAIAAAPDDEHLRLVYDDWLSDQGDPRGELGAVQVALARDPDNAALRARETSILTRHHRHFFGHLTRGDDFEVTFEHGFFRSLKVEGAWLDTLLPLVSTRLLRSLLLTGDLARIDAILAAAPLPTTLTELCVRARPAETCDLTRLLAAPNLERVDIACGKFSLRLNDVFAPRLRSLRIRTSELTLEGRLPKAALAGVTELVLEGYGVARKVLRKLTASLPSLRTLRLNGSAVAGTSLENLVAIPGFDRLEVLDLVGNFLGPTYFQGHGGELAHLRVLDLRGSPYLHDDATVPTLAGEVLLGGMEPNHVAAAAFGPPEKGEDDDEEDEDGHERDEDGDEWYDDEVDDGNRSEPRIEDEDETDDVDEEPEVVAVDQDAPMSERYPDEEADA